jgi:hypothetical protein
LLDRLSSKAILPGSTDQAVCKMKSTLIKTLPLALALAGAISTFAADESASVQTKIATSATRTIDESKLSPASLKVARLLQSGMDEKVVVAYVKNSPAGAAPTAEELVYLHQLGVPSPVLTALLTETQKAATTEVVAAATPVAAPPERVEVTSNYTPIPGAPQPVQAQVVGSAVISSPAPPPIVVQQQPTVVYAQPAPVIVETPPVIYDIRPTITFGFGFGHYGYGHYGHYRHGGYYGRHH